MVKHSVVLEQGFQMLLSPAAEKECVGTWAELFEGRVRWDEEGSTSVSGRFVESLEQTSLQKPQIERTEYGGNKSHGICSHERRDQEVIQSVDDAVLGFLEAM